MALLRYFRDLDAAEEAFQESCLRALRNWPVNGPPRYPAAWLILVGRNAGLDRARRHEALPSDEALSDIDDAEAPLVDRLGRRQPDRQRSPDGAEMPNRGVYLDVAPNERIVFTDAYVGAWEPSAKPFMTVILTFADEGGKTRYTARVRHWTVEDRDAHERRGFHQGWGLCADQMTALLATL